MTPIALFTVLGLGGCTIDSEVNPFRVEDVFNQEPSAEVDILFVVDDSPSMEEEQILVGQGFETFIQSVVDTNIDFHVGVITTDMDPENADRGKLIGTPRYLTRSDDYVSEFQQRVRVGIDGSDKEKGLSAGLYALKEPLASGYNDGFLRREATLAVLFVSDENDCSDGEALASSDGNACYSKAESLLPLRDVITDYLTLKSPDVRVVLSAIVGQEVANGCQDTWPGQRYIEASNQTGGVVGDICQGDYSAIMTDLGLNVAGLIRIFYLESQARAETIEVYVDDTLIPENPTTGWQYDEDYWAIRFDGDYVPPRGSSITVSYEILQDGSAAPER